MKQILTRTPITGGKSSAGGTPDQVQSERRRQNERGKWQFLEVSNCFRKKAFERDDAKHCVLDFIKERRCLRKFHNTRSFSLHQSNLSLLYIKASLLALDLMKVLIIFRSSEFARFYSVEFRPLLNSIAIFTLLEFYDEPYVLEIVLSERFYHGWEDDLVFPIIPFSADFNSRSFRAVGKFTEFPFDAFFSMH